MEDSDQCKLFVGGISWETTDEALREHFGGYGTVVGSVIGKDRNTGSPRGFAFVSFSDPSAVHKALKDSHTILGRTVEVKKAIPRSEQSQNLHEQYRGLNKSDRSNGRTTDRFRTKKIFVGGLSANLTEEAFKTYFDKFGRIVDVVVMHDNVTQRPRGFGFITFDSEDAVEDVMQNNFHELCGKLVEVKRAIPKDVNSGRGSSSAAYQHGNYVPYGPGYDILPSYGTYPGYGAVPGYPYPAGVFTGGYSNGGYGRIGYGLAPVAPRSPWSGTSVVGFRGSPLPYGSPAAVYPAFFNGGLGLVSFPVNGYNGVMGPLPDGKTGHLSVEVHPFPAGNVI